MYTAWDWNNWASWYWAFWMLPAFFVPELIAVFGHRYEWTLTAHLRPVFTSVGPGQPLGISYFVGLGLIMWFVYHIFIEDVF